jgi:hypothetical protein
MTSTQQLNAITSCFFRRACADHNNEFGRYLSWADARKLWKQARIEARGYVYNH